MKKRIIFILILVLIVIGFILYPFLFQRGLEKVLNVDFGKVDKIVMMSGSYGKDVEITDKDTIKEFLSMFEDTKVKKSFNQVETDGFSLIARLYEGDKEVASFSYGGSEIKTKDGRYISNKNIDHDKIKEIEEKYSLNN